MGETPVQLCQTAHHQAVGTVADLSVRSTSWCISYLPFANNHLPSLSMRRAIYPGSFDPVTNGHLDIIQRGCKLFDEIIVAVLINPEKTAFFSIQERCEILSEVLQDIDRSDCRVTVESFAGLMVEYAAERNANAIVRGIRAISDYEYELQMVLLNRRLQPL